MAYAYKPNKWAIYDDSLTFEENVERGAVITKEKIDRLEEAVRKYSADVGVGEVTYVDNPDDAQITAKLNEAEGTLRFDFVLPRGAQGEKGDNGKSVYDFYLELGGTGTEEDMMESFKGEKGDKGETGEVGPQGPQGIQGEQGIQGIQGEQGDRKSVV